MRSHCSAHDIPNVVCDTIVSLQFIYTSTEILGKAGQHHAIRMRSGIYRGLQNSSISDICVWVEGTIFFGGGGGFNKLYNKCSCKKCFIQHVQYTSQINLRFPSINITQTNERSIQKTLLRRGEGSPPPTHSHFAFPLTIFTYGTYILENHGSSPDISISKALFCTLPCPIHINS